MRWMCVGVVVVVSLSHFATAQVYPTSFRKISNVTGDLNQTLEPGALFGIESFAIGDLDDDGVIDLAVGSTNQHGSLIGALFILYMNRDGTVRSSVQINSSEPAFEQDSFGSSVCALGDLDDDGIDDIGVGAGYDSDGGFRTGAFWILFMRKDGTVKQRQKISKLAGNFTAPLQAADVFGTGAGTVGDLDGDGNLEIIVGSRIPGIAYILYLTNNGTVKNYKPIGSAQGLPIDPDGLVSYRVVGLGDVDGDGVPDVAIGGHRSDVNSFDSGAVFVVFLTASGNVKGFTRISSGMANFNDLNVRIFGVGIVGIGDYNGDGTPDMVVAGDDTGSDTGAIWYLMLNTNGTVKSYFKISSTTNNSDLVLDTGDFFGSSISFLGDLDGNGMPDIAVAAMRDDDGAPESGAIWISVPAVTCGSTSFAGNDMNVCSIQSVKMTATLTSASTGRWSTLSGSGQFSSPTDPTATVTNLGMGENKFVWTVTKGTCTPAEDIVAIIVDPVEKPNAGKDQLVCEGTAAVLLSGNSPKKMDGQWSIARGSATILNPALTNTVAVNPATGINLIVWSFLGNSYCPTMKDTVVLAVQPKPVSHISTPDGTQTCAGEFGIEADAPVNGTGEWKVLAGSADISEPGEPATTITFHEANKPVTIQWTVAVEGCPPAEDRLTILPVSFSPTVVPNVLTINNDGKNDRWKVQNLERFSNHVRIYNRWGNEVLTRINYKNDWSGEDLPPGVYYYYVTITECNIDLKGWLSIVH